jgi:hypothetical protein
VTYTSFLFEIAVGLKHIVVYPPADQQHHLAVAPIRLSALVNNMLRSKIAFVVVLVAAVLLATTAPVAAAGRDWQSVFGSGEQYAAENLPSVA